MLNRFTQPNKQTAENERYNALDGVRGYAAIGIVMMHVLANIGTKPSVNFYTSKLIPWFTNFTLLFMVISAFSMCCGYYDKIKTGTMTPAKFYSKRYSRTWPFFAMMVLISFAMEPNWSTFCQTFANLTMCFNLLPNPQIEVIGVGWFIGTVFTFYMLFPFFTYLLDNKKRAWITLALSLIFCYIAATYFSSPEMVVDKISRINILYSAPFFVVGGMIYLYRQELKVFAERQRLATAGLCVVLIIVKFAYPVKLPFEANDLILFAAVLTYAITSKNRILNNSFAKYLSSLSMEVYLCHMMFYQVTVKMHLEKMIENNDLLYVAMTVSTLAGAIAFSHIVKFMIFPKIGKIYATYIKPLNGIKI